VSKEWTRYYDAAGVDARPTLMDAVGRFELPGFAVDLGCGTGRDTFELLRRGWRVLAIDAEAEAIERLRRSVPEHELLETDVARFDEARWPHADLVNSSFALPFCSPESFGDVWRRIVDSLPSGGRFSGQLFGERDEWVTQADMTFLTRAEAEALLHDFELERFDEHEEDGKTAVGEAKHWHLFHVVARKR
jgi:trans-aconitate methyltransferase